MIIFAPDGKEKKKLGKHHTIYLKLEDGTKLRISEETKNSVSVFCMSKKKVLATQPVGERRFSLLAVKNWLLN